MIVSMTAAALSLYTVLLLYPSVRRSEGSESSDNYAVRRDTWSGAEMDGECSAEEKAEIWSFLPTCQPRNILVSIPHPTDPDVIQYIPNQVEVPRCAGTCTQEGKLYHRCSANETGVLEVPVILERILGTQTVEVCTYVKVEVHKSCKCGCSPEPCTAKQEYNEKVCACTCRDLGAMGQCLVQYNKIWDTERCSCRCRPEEWKECNTGFVYDGIFTCQCLPGPPISASTGVTVTLAVFVVVLIVSIAGLGYAYKRSRDELIAERRKNPESSRLRAESS